MEPQAAPVLFFAANQLINKRFPQLLSLKHTACNYVCVPVCMFVCVCLCVYIFISHAPHTKLIATTENDPQKPPKFHIEPNAHPDTQRNQPPTQPHCPPSSYSTLAITLHIRTHTLTCAHSPTLLSVSLSAAPFGIQSATRW